jgi:hypothetical protein
MTKVMQAPPRKMTPRTPVREIVGLRRECSARLTQPTSLHFDYFGLRGLSGQKSQPLDRRLCTSSGGDEITGLLPVNRFYLARSIF